VRETKTHPRWSNKKGEKRTKEEDLGTKKKETAKERKSEAEGWL
jgi:hypothetical protein